MKDDATATTGIPIAQKDIFCADGWRTTCGSRMLSNFVAPYDATVIAKFNAAGAVCLGKTNMDEFAMGSSNETSFYGPVKNPWNVETVPGGSSGGSAAAVAARLSPAATGTDTGGSIRQPAALTNLTGIKPSYGRVSRYGMIAFASSLDQGGPMTQTAEDAALLLKCHGRLRSARRNLRRTSRAGLRRHAQPRYQRSAHRVAEGIFRHRFEPGGCEDHRGGGQRIQKARRPGGRAKPAEQPARDSCYYVLAPAEASSNLARFDGARYGYRAPEYSDLIDMYQKTRAQGFGAEVKRRIMIGTYALSAGYYDAYYLKAQQLRRLIAEDFHQAFEACDVILGPTSPTTAFKLGEKSDDPVAMYLSDIYTISVNLAGLPGMSIPAGFDAKGLPVGLQLIGRYFRRGTPAQRGAPVPAGHRLAPAHSEGVRIAKPFFCVVVPRHPPSYNGV